MHVFNAHRIVPHALLQQHVQLVLQDILIIQVINVRFVQQIAYHVRSWALPLLKQHAPNALIRIIFNYN